MKDVVEVVKGAAQDTVSEETLGALSGVLVENLLERAAFKMLPQIFGFATTDKNGHSVFHPAKSDGKGGYVPQTAIDSRPLYMRQAFRGVTALSTFAIAAMVKEKAARTALATSGVMALAHMAQDFIPALRG
jgi:hypothetical protein